MSGNQNRDGRRGRRSVNVGHHSGGGKGGGGGAAAPSASSGQPSLNNNRSFKKCGNAQGGPNKVGTSSDVSAGFTPATTPKGAASLNGSQSHFQPSSHEAPNAPPTTINERPANVPSPRNSPHLASRGQLLQPSTRASDSSIPPPSNGDQQRAGFSLQFGAINVGIVNGLHIPARTSSALPNLDEQKRQALHDASKAMSHKAPPSGPKPQLPHPRKDPIAAVNPNPVQPQSHPHPPTQALLPQPKGPEQAPHVPGPAPVLAPPQPRPPPNVMSLPGMPLQVPFQHQQTPQQVQLQFGGHGPSIPTPQGVVLSSLQMTMTLPVGSAPPQVPQPMFVPGIQPHGLPQQALLHQSQGMGFGPPIGHQLGKPQLGGLGMCSLVPQYPQPQQSPAKFGSARKVPTVKITQPETHEEVKLENVASAPRTVHNMATQSQPIPTMTPHMGYYHSFGPSPMYFSGAANMPLTSTQMPSGSQPPHYPYPVPQPNQPITFMKQQSVINQPPSGKLASTPTSHPKKTSSKKKHRKEVLSKADAAGSSQLYSAYKGPEEKSEAISAAPDITKSEGRVGTNEEMKQQSVINQPPSGKLASTPTSHPKKTSSKKKHRKKVLSKADAAGSPELYSAYKGPEEKSEAISAAPDITKSEGSIGTNEEMKQQSVINQPPSGKLASTPTSHPKKTSSKKKHRKEVLSKFDAAGSSELYNAYKGPEKKSEAISAAPDITKSEGSIGTNEEASKEVTASEEEASGKGDLDDWKDVADLSTPKLPPLDQKAQKKATDISGKKRYSRDFLLTFLQQYSAPPAGFQVEHGTEKLFGVSILQKYSTQICKCIQEPRYKQCIFIT